MEHNSQLSLIQFNTMSANEDFYNNVFKKTERIVSATFYILSFIESSKTHDALIMMLKDRAVSLHSANLSILTVREGDDAAMRPLQYELAALESTLTILTGARLFGGGVVTTLQDEIDQVLRYLKNRVIGLGDSVPSRQSYAAPRPTVDRTLTPPRPRRVRPNIPKNDMSSDAILVYSDLGERTTRIKTVLEAKPEATIKDLTDIITDVSAKTIQRDLNSLIERGEVIRQGERRWSKYSLA
jgi:hypothetical protein